MRNLLQIKNEIEELRNYFKSNDNILSVYIFGSYGTDMQTGLSDIDIAILFNEDISFLKELKYSAEISSIIRRDDIDVINLNNAPIYLQHDILLKGEKIYEKESVKTQDFIEKVLEEHHDYGIILFKYQQDFQKGLEEEYLS